MAFDRDLIVVNGVLVTDMDVFNRCVVHNVLRVFVKSLQPDCMDKSFKAVRVFLDIFSCVLLISVRNFASSVLRSCRIRFVCIFITSYI